MTPKSHKIIFFGTEDNSLATLQRLVEHGFSVAAVITKPDAARGRGQKITEPPVKTYAKQHEIPVWQPDKLREIIDNIKNLQPIAGVLVSYGKIIPQSVIDLFEPGIINIHPSLLPRWRGPSPIEAAISHRDEKTGVTIMKLDARMDGGPIYAQEKIQLDQTETKPELYETLFSLGNDMLCKILPDILSGNLQPKDQDDRAATYCQMLSKDMSLIDPSNVNAGDAEAHVRAHLGFPRTRIQLGDHQLIITKSHVSDAKDSPLSLQCQDGKYLVVDELVAPSGKTMSAEAFIRGYSKH